jgi:hypothetical protein
VLGTRNPPGVSGSNIAFIAGIPVMAKSTLGGAVVGDKAGNHFVFHGLAFEFPILFGQFESTLDCFTTAGGEEDFVEISRAHSSASLSASSMAAGWA